MKNLLFITMVIAILSCKATAPAIPSNSQQTNTTPTQTKPQLVVGIVVDQMRYDYLTRFEKRFGEGGFNRLINNGYNFKNNHFNYIPTYTGPGHASIFTGTTPQNHGIISNTWYNKFEDTAVYCVEDESQNSLGTSSNAGKMSPHRMQTTTFADQNRLHTQLRGKTIGISLKDRGAILPAGHTANAAYWFEAGTLGHWISSSFYMNELPSWVKKFNTSDIAESYIKDWKLYYDVSTYTASGADTNTYEGGFTNNTSATFPYVINKEDVFKKIKSTPYGNSLTTDFALAAVQGEDLGRDEDTDVLTVSYSSTDYVGHNFGVNSVEIEDTYIRLDKDIERLLNGLDDRVGRDNYVVFLTSDHGAVHVPNYLKSVNIPSGYFNISEFKDTLTQYIATTYAEPDLIKDISNYQVFFDYDVLQRNNISAQSLQQELKHFILQQNLVYKVFTRDQLESTDYTSGIPLLVQQGYHQKRSGDIVFLLDPSYISYTQTGSTHGSGLQYDTHVPLVFYGNGIKQGESFRRTAIVDIAPTISALLGIAFPNGSTGEILKEALD